MIKRNRSWEHKVKPCDDSDGASRQDKVKTWNSGKGRWAKETKNFDEPLNWGINHLDEQE